jgi:hypothetical protein
MPTKFRAVTSLSKPKAERIPKIAVQMRTALLCFKYYCIPVREGDGSWAHWVPF